MPEPIDPQDEDNITLKKEDYEKLVEEHANSTQAKTNLTNEITEIRKTRQEARDEVENLTKENKKLKETPAPDTDNQNTDVKEAAKQVVEAILSEREEGEVKKNMAFALDDFKDNMTEFHSDNDEGGLKFEAFKKSLSKFNFEGLSTKDDFKSVFGDAYKLLVKEDKKDEINNNAFSSSPSDESNQPKVMSVDNLSTRELKFIERSYNGDKEKYLKVKAKRPDYINSLLEWMK